MAPGGSGSPGITSSSPVENSATRGRAATSSVAMPTVAARPMAAASRRWPARSTTWPARTSSPWRRMAMPGAGSSLMRTRAEGRRPVDTTASQCSCMTTASAPGGTCAPVKMRAAVPAASGSPGRPATMRWLTGSTVPAPPTRSARRTA